MASQTLKQNTEKYFGMYQVVFSSRFVKIAVLILFGSLLLQPIAPAYASENNEVVTAQVPAAAEVIQESTIAQLPEDTEEVEVMTTVEQVVVNDEVVAEDAEDESPAEVDVEEVLLTEASTNQVEESASSTSVEVASASQESNNQNTATATTMSTENVDLVTSSTSTSTSTSDINENSNSTPDPETEINSDSSSDAVSNEESEPVATSTVVDNAPIVNPGSEHSVNENNQSQETESELENENEVLDEVEEQIVTSTSSATSTEPEASATTTNEQVVVVSTAEVINNDNRFQFGTGECTSVGDGSFYCSQKADLPELIEDGVFSVPDKDGDMEIMVRINGEVRYLTDNQTDDLAPYFDSISNRIVWHSLQNDRYQIASYDFVTNETTYLTAESYNNMEPVAHGKITLWQAWVDDNWEIMLHDGSEVTQLTDNEVHDVAPHMRGGYVTWQSQFVDGWKVAMYDLESKKIEYIGDGDGSRVENPRFVLVYDSTDANGNVATVGYDFDTKTTQPLSRVPGRLPEKLPDSDSTGETRALIQNKSVSREGEVEEAQPVVSGSGNNKVPTSTKATATSSDPLTLDISTATTTVTNTATSTNDLIPDVVIEAPTTTSTTSVVTSESIETGVQSTDHIPDVVVPSVASSSDEISE